MSVSDSCAAFGADAPIILADAKYGGGCFDARALRGVARKPSYTPTVPDDADSECPSTVPYDDTASTVIDDSSSEDSLLMLWSQPPRPRSRSTSRSSIRRSRSPRGRAPILVDESPRPQLSWLMRTNILAEVDTFELEHGPEGIDQTLWFLFDKGPDGKELLQHCVEAFQIVRRDCKFYIGVSQQPARRYWEHRRDRGSCAMYLLVANSARYCRRTEIALIEHVRATEADWRYTNIGKGGEHCPDSLAIPCFVYVVFWLHEHCF